MEVIILLFEMFMVILDFAGSNLQMLNANVKRKMEGHSLKLLTIDVDIPLCVDAPMQSQCVSVSKLGTYMHSNICIHAKSRVQCGMSESS